MRILLLILALVAPQVVAAGVYMCVDPETGKKTLTDRACSQSTSGEEVRVDPVNFGGAAYRAPTGEHKQTWRSQREVAKSGRQHTTGYRGNIERARRAGDAGD